MVKRLLIVLASVAVFAAGCANSSTSSSSSGGGAPGGSSAMPSGVPSAPGPAASGESTKLSGTLEQGVEPSCIVLKGTGPDHTLYFSDPELKKQAKFGDKVTVLGQAKPGQMTTCQQGIPFLVEAMAVD
jgi:hypothetical protein